MAGLYRIGGWDALLLISATILATVYTAATARLSRAGLGIGCAVLCTGLAITASAANFHVRPSLLTIAFFLATSTLLIEVEAQRLRIRHLWLLVPLFILWTNMHGGVLGGLATLFIVVAGWFLASILRRDSPVRSVSDAIELSLLLATCSGTLLVNPYGILVPQLWIRILRLPLSELVVEHRPLFETGMVGIMTSVFALLYIVTLAGVAPKKVRVTWIVPLVWLVLAVGRVRHTPLFAISALLALSDLLPYSSWAVTLTRRGWFRPALVESADRRRHFEWGKVLLPSAIVTALFLAQVSEVPFPIVGHGAVQLDSQWPVDLLPELRRIESDSAADICVFNDCLFGGFLIFHTPQLRIFIDDRFELYGSDFIVDYLNTVYVDPERIEAWSQEYGFNYALVERNTPLDRFLRRSENWTAIKHGSAASLYHRNLATATMESSTTRSRTPSPRNISRSSNSIHSTTTHSIADDLDPEEVQPDVATSIGSKH